MHVKRIVPVAVLGITFLCGACASRKPEALQFGPAVRRDFDDLTGWVDDSQNESPHSYAVENGVLRMTTRPDTRDRVKVRSTERFGPGRYTWRVYVPAMGQGDQASIGAFLYRDDKHEVDFEIGYGNAAVRKKVRARDDEMVCYCTSQGHPYSSSQFAVKSEQWYELAIELRDGAAGLDIEWFIDGKPVKELRSKMAATTTFTIHNSVENLTFIGDHIPQQSNYGLFDWVEFRPMVAEAK